MRENVSQRPVAERRYLVRVKLQRQLPVRALDLLVRGARRDPEDVKRIERPNLARAATSIMPHAVAGALRARASSAALRT